MMFKWIPMLCLQVALFFLLQIVAMADDDLPATRANSASVSEENIKKLSPDDMKKAREDSENRWEKTLKEDKNLESRREHLRRHGLAQDSIVRQVKDYNTGKIDSSAEIFNLKHSEGEVLFALANIKFRYNKSEFDQLLDIIGSKAASFKLKTSIVALLPNFKNDEFHDELFLKLKSILDGREEDVRFYDEIRELKNEALGALAKMNTSDAYIYIKNIFMASDGSKRIYILRMLSYKNIAFFEKLKKEISSEKDAAEYFRSFDEKQERDKAK